jgi:hypothetical protein
MQARSFGKMPPGAARLEHRFGPMLWYFASFGPLLNPENQNMGELVLLLWSKEEAILLESFNSSPS